MSSFDTPARNYSSGIGTAVANRTINRTKSDGSRETWSDVAYRVALGNASLRPEDAGFEFEAMHHHLRQAAILMSGRHLQHGDAEQPSRNQEVFTNCSTSASSFILFYLLLNGSGVGRAYDDDMMVVDWAGKMPKVHCVIKASHPDILTGEIPRSHIDEAVLTDMENATVYIVPDSREGWAKAVEQVERMTWEGTRGEEHLILDFSNVRARGEPIGGMQGRPASGPGPLMTALSRIAEIRGNGMAPWKATMYVDHHLAECVLVGGARRAARMATKTWRDGQTALEFVSVKKGGVLWSSNNSITVDEEFWTLVKDSEKGTTKENVRAEVLFDAICEASYHDGTGEPGLINMERLTQKNDGIEALFDGKYAESARFQMDPETLAMTGELARIFSTKEFTQITNPCVTADTWVQTAEGPQQVADLIDKPYVAIINGKSYNATGFWKTGDKPVFKVKTSRGYEVRATEDHKILVETSRKRRLDGSHNVEQEWVEVKDLQPGDKLVLNSLLDGTPASINSTERDIGWLLGEMVGDGGHNPEKYRGYVRFWGNGEGVQSAQRAVDLIASLPDTYHTPVPASDRPSYSPANDTWTVGSRKLDILADGLIEKFAKTPLPALEKKSKSFTSGFLRGLFDADGSVQGSAEKGLSIRLAQSNLQTLKAAQRMLLRLGIASTIYEERRPEHVKMMPTPNYGDYAEFTCKAQHELVISKNNIIRFAMMVGFYDEQKLTRLAEVLEACKARGFYAERFTADVESITPDGTEAVYDCTVDEVHRFDANGIIVHNCGEISLAMLGGYCVIADVVPYHSARPNHADWDRDAEDAFRVATRALIRVNQMNCLYRREVDRTNRIGVGITGLHEYAFARFGYGWKDLVDEEKSRPFWEMLGRFSNACVNEAIRYSKKLGVNVPHTVTTMKPAGTTSKLFGLTEGAHLPSMREYLRWVQFRNGDPIIEQYAAKGYPVRELKSYSGTTIVGFPTVPEICHLEMGDKLVTAAEATPEEQYEYLRLLEKWWIEGSKMVVVDTPFGMKYTPFKHDFGNQVSYTLKYDPKVVGYEEFRKTLLEGQSTIRCCSVMPQGDATAYEYQPETPVSRTEFEDILSRIDDPEMKQDIGFEHVDCGAGGCPIDWVGDKEAAA